MLLEQCKKKGASFSEHRAHAQQHSCNGVYDTYVNQNKKRNTNKNYRKKGEKGSIYWFLFDLNRYSKSASYFPFPFLKKKKRKQKRSAYYRIRLQLAAARIFFCVRWAVVMCDAFSHKAIKSRNMKRTVAELFFFGCSVLPSSQIRRQREQLNKKKKEQ